MRRAELAQGCTLNSDCSSPLVCAFKSCHVACSSSRDCPNGARCVQSDKPFLICQNPSETTCARNSDCPALQVCGIDQKCRDACVTDRDCPKDQSCASGTCADKAELSSGMLPVIMTDAGGGTPCVHSTECPGTLVCRREGVCGLECMADKDCFVTWRCDPTNGRCTPPADGGL